MKRYFLLSVFLLGYAIAELFNHLFLFLDEIFYPAYKRAPLRSALFVVSMPRSATTWLQEVICSDHEQFTAMKLWEMLFAPSVIQKKLFLLIRKVDFMAGSPVTRRISKLDKKLFSAYSPIHPSSLFGYEDDELVMLHTASSFFMIFFLPRLRSYDFLLNFDDTNNTRKKERYMKFYRGCILRHMYVFGKGRIYFSKSPVHSLRMKSLQQYFPGSRFLCTVREPEQMIVSAISLLNRFNKVFHSGFSKEFLTARTLAVCDRLFPSPYEVFCSWPESVYYLNLYSDLIKNLTLEITKIYQHFNFTLSDEFKKKLEMERLRAQSFKSSHEYCMEDWGLTREILTKRYGEIYKKYQNACRADVIV